MALELLAERNGLAPATQAAMLLRQGLDRTMESAEFAKRYKQYLAQRTTSAWQQDQMEEHVIETTYKARGASIDSA
jgi:hypothetical protein